MTVKHLVRLLYQSELRVSQDAPDDALWSLLATPFDQATVAGTGEYDLPGKSATANNELPLLRVISIELKVAHNYYPARLVSLDELWKADHMPLQQARNRTPVASLTGRETFKIRPIPEAAVATGLRINYLKTPRRRFRHTKSTVTTTDITNDDALIDTVRTEKDDWWTGRGLLGAASVSAFPAAGSGYVVGDLITLTGGTFTVAAVLKVTSIDGSNGVTGVSITTIGDYTVRPANAVAQGSTDGVGSGATFTMLWTTHGSEASIRLLSGIMEGEEHEVASYQVGAFVLRNNWSGNGAYKPTYVVGEISDLEDMLQPLVLDMAMAFAWEHYKETDLAQLARQSYQSALEVLVGKYDGTLHEVPSK